MFIDRQTVEQNIELGTETHGSANAADVGADRVTVDYGVARSARGEPGQHGHCGRLSRAVVTQQHEYLVLVHVEVQIAHGFLRFTVRKFEGLKIIKFNFLFFEISILQHLMIA